MYIYIKVWNFMTEGCPNGVQIDASTQKQINAINGIEKIVKITINLILSIGTIVQFHHTDTKNRGFEKYVFESESQQQNTNHKTKSFPQSIKHQYKLYARESDARNILIITEKTTKIN